MKLKIDNQIIGNDCPPYIIAELSANHNGSLERALKTIEAAKYSGANAVKLQTYTADSITINCDKPEFIIRGGLWDGYKLYDLYKWAETPYEWHKEMFDYAKKIGITIFSTPFDETAVDLLEKLNAPAYKIASFEIVDLRLIKYVAKTKKPMIISTGMASEQEIEEAISVALEFGGKDLILLHCISGYPTPLEQVNIKQIPNLAKRFKVLTGLSDHTLGTTASIAAIAQGACLIEKHFILDRNEKSPDSKFSIEPKELKKLCIEAKDAWLSLGKPSFERQKAEMDNKIFRRSLYFIQNLKAGQKINVNDIKSIRPGMGLSPKYFDKIIGKTVINDVFKGQAVKFKDIK